MRISIGEVPLQRLQVGERQRCLASEGLQHVRTAAATELGIRPPRLEWPRRAIGAPEIDVHKPSDNSAPYAAP